MTKFKIDQPIIITRHGSLDPENQRKKNKRRGVLDFLPEDHDLKRRLASDLVTFYDLGQINTGTTEAPVWNDLPAVFVPDVSVEIQRGLNWYDETILFTVQKLDSAQWIQYREQLLDVPVEQWKDTYRKIEKASSFQPHAVIFRDKDGDGVTLDANFDGDFEIFGLKWTDQGLQHKGLTKLSLGSRHQDWFYFDTGDPSWTKITSVPDPEADEVEFDFHGKINLFLVPMLKLHTIQTEYGFSEDLEDPDVPAGVNHSVVWNDVSGFFYCVHPRKLHPLTVDPDFDPLYGDVSANPAGIKTNWRDHVLAHPAARAWRSVRDYLYPIGSSAHSTTTFLGSISPSDFGNGHSNYDGGFYSRELGTPVLLSISDVYFASSGVFFLENDAEALLLTAVAQKGNQFFYFWDVAQAVWFDSATKDGGTDGFGVHYDP